MEIFVALWNNWSNYEKILTGEILLSLLILIPLIIYLFTKNRKLIIFSTISLVISAILTVISFTVLSLIFKIEITNIFLLIPLISLFVNILNLGTLVGFYCKSSKNKNFTFEALYKEYLRDTFKLSIVLITLFCLSTIFLSSILLSLLISSLSVCILTIWINYTLIPKFSK